MIRTSILILFAFIYFEAIGQYRNQTLFPGESGSRLTGLLFDQYKPTSVLSYTDARVRMYKEIYNVHDSVFCIYSHHGLYLDPAYPNPIDYLSKSGSNNGINCEHSFPQSKGADIGNARSDMHHLYPARAAVNEARSNYPYAEIDDSKTKTWYYQAEELSTRPKSMIEEYSEGLTGFFEPREDHKGNSARAIFYFFTMYEIQSDRAFFESMRPTLCNWHLLDPVDSLEWKRTYMIAKYQDGKPNPFVLDCSLPQRCYCEGLNPCLTGVEDYSAEAAQKLISPNPTAGQLQIRLDHPEFIIEKIEITDFSGRLMFSRNNPELSTDEHLEADLTNWPSGIYFCRLQTVQGHRATIKLARI